MTDRQEPSPPPPPQWIKPVPGVGRCFEKATAEEPSPLPVRGTAGKEMVEVYADDEVTVEAWKSAGTQGRRQRSSIAAATAIAIFLEFQSCAVFISS